MCKDSYFLLWNLSSGFSLSYIQISRPLIHLFIPQIFIGWLPMSGALPGTASLSVNRAVKTPAFPKEPADGDGGHK